MTTEEIIIRLTFAMILGSVVGFNRGMVRDEVSMRTFGIVSLGSALFVIVSAMYGKDHANEQVMRTVAQIVSGIGFLGAGFIFFSEKEGKRVGMTTAASIWVAAGLGVACGFGYYSISIITTILVLLTLIPGFHFERKISAFFKK